MIIVMRPDADGDDVARVVAQIRAKGLREHISRGQECTIIGAVGDERVFDAAQMEKLPKVARAIRIVHDWRLVSREAWAQDTVLTVRGQQFGGGQWQTVRTAAEGVLPAEAAVFADPFGLPDTPYISPEQTAQSESARLKRLAADIKTWHGAGKTAWVRIRDTRQLDGVLAAGADVLYLGGALMEQAGLLQELGCLNVPVVLCKNRHHTVRDWLVAAEQVVVRGNPHIILGEAGTMSLHGGPLRLDVDAVAEAKKLSYLPVLADISALTHRHMDEATLFKLAQAAGADGVLVSADFQAA